MRAWIAFPLIACSLLSGCKHRSSQAGSQPATGSASSISREQVAASQQQAELMNVATTEMETDVPEAAQRAIPVLKEALVALEDDVLASQPATATAAQVQQALNRVLPAGKSTDTPAPKPNPGQNEFDVPEKGDFGGDISASVSDLMPGVLLVDTSLGVMCGEDNILLGYSNKSGQWKRVLRWQSAPYKQVSDAFGDIFLPSLLTPKRNGHPVLLVVHGTPWCTSTESNFKMDAFELDPAIEVEKPFWHREHDYRRADDDIGFHLKDTPGGFEVRTSVDDRIGDSVNRIGILRYALIGNTLQRVLPIAMNSRESVSAWLDMPRDEAKQFTNALENSETWRTWQALTFSGKSSDAASNIPLLSYGDVHACTDAKHYQVTVGTETFTSGHKNTPGPDYFFQVEETGSGYRIREASTQPDSGCNGNVIKLESSGEQSATGAQ